MRSQVGAPLGWLGRQPSVQAHRLLCASAFDFCPFASPRRSAALLVRPCLDAFRSPGPSVGGLVFTFVCFVFSVAFRCGVVRTACQLHRPHLPCRQAGGHCRRAAFLAIDPCCLPRFIGSLALLGFVVMHARLCALNMSTIEAYEKRPVK